MTDALALGAKLLALLEESARTTTYKPALLLALIDRVQEYVEHETVPVRALAERVVELYWPQTLAYPTTGGVLRQSQTSTGRAAIVRAILAFRDQHATAARALPPAIRHAHEWERLLTRVEETLAEWPIPRLQRRYEPFLYAFDWGWAEAGGWSVRAYRNTARTIRLYPGVGDALTALGPLLRPFITRWWTDKAAQLNPDVEAARSVLEFEDFLFGRDRTALERIAEGLLDLQNGDCFYCHTALSRNREIDHFIPWSHSGDDGLDNLVAACHRCNNSKRATLAAQTTSPTSSNATVPGPMTSLPFRTSGGGHATPTVLSVLRAPPTSTPLANAAGLQAAHPSSLRLGRRHKRNLRLVRRRTNRDLSERGETKDVLCQPPGGSDA